MPTDRYATATTKGELHGHTACTDCGVLVADTDVHDRWHNTVDEVATDAAAGRRADSMLGPIA